PHIRIDLYPEQLVPALPPALVLFSHEIHHHVAATQHSDKLQIRQFFSELRRYSGRPTNARRFAMVPRHRRRRPAKHALLPRATLRVLFDSERRPALSDGFSLAPASAHSLGRRNHARDQTGETRSGGGVRNHVERRRSPDHPVRREAEGGESARRNENGPRSTRGNRARRR